MNTIFWKILQMSVSASFVALILLIIKNIMTKLSCIRSFTMILYLVIALRFVCPYMPQSNMSVFNFMSENTVHREEVYLKGSGFIHSANKNGINITAPLNDGIPKTNTSPIYSYIYLSGAAIMMIYGVYTYLRLKHRLKFSMKIRDNVYSSDEIDTSFVLGLIRPRIYIPSFADETSVYSMLAHERAHIKRLDHIFKATAYMILCIHWFNPFAWILFKLYSRDVEYSCDEKVLKGRNPEEKKLYINSLLYIASAKSKIHIPASQCLFNSETKSRIRNMIKLKNHSAAAKIITIILCTVICIGFATDKKFSLISHAHKIAITDAAVPDNIYPIPESVNAFPESTDAAYDTDYTTSDTPDSYQDDIMDSPAYTSGIPEQFTPISAPQLDTVKPVNTTISSKDNNFRYKSDFVSDEPYMGCEFLEFDGMDTQKLESLLKNDGINSSPSGKDLNKNYIKGSCNYSDKSEVSINNVKCDANGNISLYMDMNSPSSVNFRIYESDSGKEVENMEILANGDRAYSIIGFDKNKTYDISIESMTGDEWKIEGEYIIY